jgi:hypothetical protein
MIPYRISFLLIFFSLAAFTCLAGRYNIRATLECVNYEPETVSLVGTLSRRTFINASDQKEVVWILKLAEPICVNADDENDFNVRRSSVTDVQLVVLDRSVYSKHRELLGRRAKVTGTLFGEHTAHHFTPVLLSLTGITPYPK